MKKIGIISLFDISNMNYGNRLQTYALNKYLRNKFLTYDIESLYFCNIKRNIKNNNRLTFYINKIPRIYYKLNEIISKKFILKNRLKKCNIFSEQNIKLCIKPFTYNDLVESNYDAFIVGSDIVWGQSKYNFSKERFLDFKTKKHFKRISYAASFGRDWIPKENIANVARCLKKFQKISVRENSSIQLLNRIGIDNAVHTLDPTLLLSANDWQKIERKPEMVTEKFIFVYFLGKSKTDRKNITLFAKENNLKIITIPYACGEFNWCDRKFGDIRLLNCSPEEWVWLIHNAEYIITDSFHGTVFSTIFQKRFVVLERKFVENINNRMIDYLKTIKESDKMINSSQLNLVKTFNWDYEKINKLLKVKREFSKDFLNNALREI